jgi:hypothetical protein
VFAELLNEAGQMRTHTFIIAVTSGKETPTPNRRIS